METLSSSSAVGSQNQRSVESVEEIPVSPVKSFPPTQHPEPAADAVTAPSFSPVALPVVVAGAGFASMAVTGALALAANQRSKDSLLSWEERSAARAQAEDLAVVSDVSLGVGLAASVASVVALIIRRRALSTQQTDLLLIPAGPATGPGLTLSGRFGRAGGPR